jgi:enoyl-CoA hydratase/carnithine racemase
LPLLVGKAKAIEMMFKGTQLTPEEAEKIGLVTAVFPGPELYEKSLDYAARLARQATAAIARIKRCVNIGLQEGFASGLAAEQQAFRDNIVSRDAREGVAAFLEGRQPVFDGNLK